MAKDIPVCPSCKNPVGEKKGKGEDVKKWTCKICGDLTNPDYVTI